MFIFQEIVSKLSLADLNKKVVIQPTQGTPCTGYDEKKVQAFAPIVVNDTIGKFNENVIQPNRSILSC